MRLVDADRLCENLKWMAKYQPNDKQNTILGVVSTIENAPTVDIKTEVAREIFEEIEKIIFLKHGFNESRAVAEMDFEELKKIRNKYTEGNK